MTGRPASPPLASELGKRRRGAWLSDETPPPLADRHNVSIIERKARILRTTIRHDHIKRRIALLL
jgi:hypothetical protein